MPRIRPRTGGARTAPAHPPPSPAQPLRTSRPTPSRRFKTLRRLGGTDAAGPTPARRPALLLLCPLSLSLSLAP
eukprot:11874-Prymnesium_polylepis.1